MSKPTVATLATEIKYIKEGVDDLNKKIDHNLMPRQEIELRIAEITKDITELKADITVKTQALDVKIEEAKRKNRFQVWITGSLSAGFGVILTLLLTYVFNDIVSK